MFVFFGRVELVCVSSNNIVSPSLEAAKLVLVTFIANEGAASKINIYSLKHALLYCQVIHKYCSNK